MADETGLLLQPLVRRTWGPRGQPPVLYSWDRRERLSVISALSVSPRRRRLTLFFRMYSSNICHEDFQGFAIEVMRHFPRGVIWILDRWSVHRAAVSRLRKRFPRRFCVEWLPPYAPELNPVEQIWTRTKYGRLANYIPEDLNTLCRSARLALRQLGKQQTSLKSCFIHAKLKL